MTTIDRAAAITDWIAAANSHDSARFLSFFTEDALLDDPSVGDAFEGRDGIGRYYSSYFIDYDTQTKLIRTEQRDDIFFVEVDFTGSFPGGQTGGTFEVTFDGAQIAHIRADLL